MSEQLEAVVRALEFRMPPGQGEPLGRGMPSPGGASAATETIREPCVRRRCCGLASGARTLPASAGESTGVDIPNAVLADRDVEKLPHEEAVGKEVSWVV